MSSLGILLALTSGIRTASASSRYHVVRHVPAHQPAAVVHVNAWSPHYVPAARPGYSWVTGRYVLGRYQPGYWRPLTAAPRVGWLWVPGWWRGTVYVDGYWRPPAVEGQVWVDGYYAQDGTWVAGRFVSQAEYDAMMGGPPAPPPYAPPYAPPAPPPYEQGYDAPPPTEPHLPRAVKLPSDTTPPPPRTDIVGEVYTTNGPALLTQDGTLLDPDTLQPLDLGAEDLGDIHAAAPER